MRAVAPVVRSLVPAGALIAQRLLGMRGLRALRLAAEGAHGRGAEARDRVEVRATRPGSKARRSNERMNVEVATHVRALDRRGATARTALS